jgi:hypothetical protein
MADQNNSDVLNRVLVCVYRGLLQYAVDCWPWTSSSEFQQNGSAEQKALEEMAARQRALIARLVDMHSRRGQIVDFGSYPDNSELHYVALDYLLKKLITDEQRLVAELETARAVLEHDREASGLISEMLAAEKEHILRLEQMAKAAAPASL